MTKFLSIAAAAMISTSAFAQTTTFLGQDRFSDESFLITEPVHAGSNLAVISTTENDETGVCRYLGYERYAPQSARWLTNKSKLNVWVDANGAAVKAEFTAPLKSLICVNKVVNVAPPQESALIETPILHGASGIALSAQTTEQLQGACTYAGFGTYLGGAKYANKTEQVILLGADLAVAGAPSGKALVRLVCLK